MVHHPGLLSSAFTMPACEQHFHDHDETWVILAGAGNAFLIDHEGRREDVDLHAGDVLMIPAGHEHGSDGPNTFAMVAVNGTLAEGAQPPGHYYVERERYVPSLQLVRTPSDRYPPDATFRRDRHGEGGGLAGRTVAVLGPTGRAAGRAADAVAAALRSGGAEVATGPDPAALGSCDALVVCAPEAPDGVVRAAVAAGKPVAALGEGLRALLAAQVLGSRTVAAPAHLHDELADAGAVTGPMPVCTDTGLVTARGEGALDAWVAKVVEVFAEGRHPLMGRSAP